MAKQFNYSNPATGVQVTNAFARAGNIRETVRPENVSFGITWDVYASEAALLDGHSPLERLEQTVTGADAIAAIRDHLKNRKTVPEMTDELADAAQFFGPDAVHVEDPLLAQLAGG